MTVRLPSPTHGSVLTERGRIVYSVDQHGEVDGYFDDYMSDFEADAAAAREYEPRDR